MADVAPGDLTTRHESTPQGIAKLRAREAITTVAKLLVRKQQLVEAIQDDPGPEERDELARQLAQINETLNELDGEVPDEPAAKR